LVKLSRKNGYSNRGWFRSTLEDGEALMRTADDGSMGDRQQPLRKGVRALWLGEDSCSQDQIRGEKAARRYL